MNHFINKIYKNSTLVYKVVLFLVATIAIVYLFPKAGQFKYDFNNGKPWQYANLYAPFDFAIQKTAEQIAAEKTAIADTSKHYFVNDTTVVTAVYQDFMVKLAALKTQKLFSSASELQLERAGVSVLNNVYTHGYLDVESEGKVVRVNDFIVLRTQNNAQEMAYHQLVTSKKILTILSDNLGATPYSLAQKTLFDVLLEVLKPNVSFDAAYTEKELEESLQGLSYTTGKVSVGELIVLKGDIVAGKKLAVLNSFKIESESKVWTESNYYWIVLGYSILVSLALLMLLLFLRKYRVEIYEDNNKVTFIIFNVFLMILVQTLVVKYNSDYLYIVPLSILPIVLKAFFDARLGLFTHVLTILLLGFIVPNSFEFIYLHIIAGIVTILTVSELYKRANLFISIGQITFIYMLTYLAFSIIKEGNASQINWTYFGLFAANGVLSFLSVFFIYSYEKIFRLVSDVTLLELSNTNSKLLRDLNEKAPGTFQHSMQVANLAEAAANEIGANSMLVRTGALYHDIGKMLNPKYFIENQSTSVNPHNDLAPRDSATIILEHVIKGIELAKQHGLPDRIIDFIRTHHGTSLVYYFYKKEMEANPDSAIDIKKFQYNGPVPFSKETAILMMCDAAEAASKSLKEPSAQSIDSLIDAIVEKQKSDNQFVNSDITFREIEKIKKVIKKKLMNIYHVRVAYPE